MKSTIGILDNGSDLAIDIQRLLDTRLLVQSNSGGGKSWALRRIHEQTAGKVQQIVLDTEGEFSTLREKFDYILCAPSGADVVATPHTAPLLARHLRESRVSAIIDLYELKAHDRRRFVRLFLEEFIEAPKTMWHPALVTIDEAHLYCPEKGESEAAAAVIDLCSRGRKRGLAALLATQRLSKLHKDAAAECLNKMVGRTGLDVDVKRASEELGMTARDAVQTLRNLDPGEFFCFGPALTKAVMRVTVGAVQTRHPKPGDRGVISAPAPSEKIRKVLAKLADLPQQAEQEARTMQDLKAEVSKLKRDLATATKQAKVETRDVSVLTDADRSYLLDVISNLQHFAKEINEGKDELKKAYDTWINTVVSFESDSQGLIHNLRRAVSGGVQVTRPAEAPRPAAKENLQRLPSREKLDLPKGESEILRALIQFPGGLRKEQISVLTTFARSTRDRYLQYLKQKGFADDSGGIVTATDAGRAAMPNAEPLPTGAALRDYWLAILPAGEKKILDVLISEYPNSITRDDLSERTEFARSTRDRYLQYMENKMIVTTTRGEVRASDNLF